MLKSFVCGFVAVLTLAALGWGAWIYTTWALQARGEGQAVTLAILAVLVGLAAAIR